MISAELGELRNVGLRQDIERHQGCNSLAIGWNLKYVVAAVVSADRLHPFRFVVGKIILAEQTVMGVAIAYDLCGDLALVISIATLSGNAAQAARQIGLAMDRAGGRCPAIDQVSLAGLRGPG